MAFIGNSYTTSQTHRAYLMPTCYHVNITIVLNYWISWNWWFVKKSDTNLDGKINLSCRWSKNYRHLCTIQANWICKEFRHLKCGIFVIISDYIRNKVCYGIQACKEFRQCLAELTIEGFGWCNGNAYRGAVGGVSKRQNQRSLFPWVRGKGRLSEGLVEI